MTVDLASTAGAFGQLLHAAGLPTSPERSGRFAKALQIAAAATVDEVYWVSRITLVADQRELEVFDAVFAQVFGGFADLADYRGDQRAPSVQAAERNPVPPGHRVGETRSDQSVPGSRSAGGENRDAGGDGRSGAVLAAMSSEERLRTTDFSALSPDELAALRALMARLALSPPPRPSRRHAPNRRGRQVDLRATLRRAQRTGGDPFRLQRRRARTRNRRLVFLCDISGSMEPFARSYLQLLFSAVGGTRAEAFVFATRLSRITRSLRATNPDRALWAAARTAPDWSGGTRIGEALRAFNDQYGRRGMARGAVIVIVSDGWERDDPTLLGREMERLSRLAHRVVWVNPRKASPRYEPLAGGMAAALPYVDDFVSGHSLAALDSVIAAIGRE